MVALHRMVGSLVHCFEGDAKRLEIPTSIADDTLAGAELASGTERQRNDRDAD